MTKIENSGGGATAFPLRDQFAQLDLKAMERHIAEEAADMVAEVRMIAMDNKQFLTFYEKLSTFDDAAAITESYSNLSFNPRIVAQMIGVDKWKSFCEKLRMEITSGEVKIVNLFRDEGHIQEVKLAYCGNHFRMHRHIGRMDYLAFGVALVIAGCDSHRLREVTGMVPSSGVAPQRFMEILKFWESIEMEFNKRDEFFPWWTYPMTSKLQVVTSPCHIAVIEGLALYIEDGSRIAIQSNILRMYAALRYLLSFSVFSALRVAKTRDAAADFGINALTYAYNLNSTIWVGQAVRRVQTGSERLLALLCSVSGAVRLSIPTEMIELATKSKTLLGLDGDARRRLSFATIAGKALFAASFTSFVIAQERIGTSEYTHYMQEILSHKEVGNSFRASLFFDCVEFQQNMDVSVGSIASDAFYVIYYLSIYMDYNQSTKFTKYILGWFSEFENWKM